ncbi:hypothetical protein AAFF_G00054600 [Aldrovandia affinis]|uniref:Transcription factor Adf-1-like n=1 Tax=Aldrovandia affinis TaxID=143900 RepID=A0AAD7WED5_9TELE|nr:hypothetical protein AAFF_G00054600 [Aldrovandia affinis]
MEEKLILAVYEYPELYNSTLPIYRNIDRKADAWRNIGALVGLSGDEAKRKWKNLRDRYIKEMKADRTRVATEAGVQKQWRFQHFLDFLKPFVRDRQHRLSGLQEGQDSSTTSDEGDDKSQLKLPFKLAPKLAPAPHLAQLTQLALVTQLSRPVTPPAPSPSPSPSPTPVHGPDSAPPSHSGHPTRGGYRKRKQAENGDFQSDEDELFLLSLVPAMKRLTPQKRCEAKIRIQQIMFEVEFM